MKTSKCTCICLKALCISNKGFIDKSKKATVLQIKHIHILSSLIVSEKLLKHQKETKGTILIYFVLILHIIYIRYLPRPAEMSWSALELAIILRTPLVPWAWNNSEKWHIIIIFFYWMFYDHLSAHIIIIIDNFISWKKTMKDWIRSVLWTANLVFMIDITCDVGTPVM